MATGQSIKQHLSSLADEKIAAHSRRFFKTGKGEYGEGDQFLGIRVPPLRAVAKKHRNIPRSQIEKLLSSAFHEIRLCAAFILVDQFKRADVDAKTDIYNFYLANSGAFNGWDLVDSSAHQILGGYLFNRERDPLYQLASSSMLWERRMAIIATLYFIREQDYADTLAIAEQLLEDEEDLIHKATGWMLREVGKRDPGAAESFLITHHRNMPRVMLRYAIEKLPTEDRKRYLDGTA